MILTKNVVVNFFMDITLKFTFLNPILINYSDDFKAFIKHSKHPSL